MELPGAAASGHLPMSRIVPELTRSQPTPWQAPGLHSGTGFPPAGLRVVFSFPVLFSASPSPPALWSLVQAWGSVSELGLGDSGREGSDPRELSLCFNSSNCLETLPWIFTLNVPWSGRLAGLSGGLVQACRHPAPHSLLTW